ncbi:MAG: hypothetical protein AAFV25_10840 [Bacteroidota bacterium]
MEFVRAVLKYNRETQEVKPNVSNSFEELYADFRSEQMDSSHRFHLVLHPKQDTLVLEECYLEFRLTADATTSFWCNGFQSSSISRMWCQGQGFSGPSWLDRFRSPLQGDYHFPNTYQDDKRPHSWTYALFGQGDHWQVVGSLLESTAFTLMEYDLAESVLRVRKDCQGLQLTHSFPILNLLLYQGTQQEVCEAYFKAFADHQSPSSVQAMWIHRPHQQPSLQQALEALPAETFDIIVLDQSYATSTGDWLDPSPALQEGLGGVARAIRQSGRRSCIQLAPFVCSASSHWFRERKNCLLKGPDGQPLKLRALGSQKEDLYVLDFYREEVQDHLTKLLLRLTEKWGFDAIYLDALYAVCVWPRPDKTRGQLLYDALDFVQSMTEGRLLFMGQVPLAGAWGSASVVQQGARLPHRWSARSNIREKTAVVDALRMALESWPLTSDLVGHWWGAFSLVDGKNSLSSAQQHTQLLIQTLLGTLLSTADDWSAYQPEQESEWAAVWQWRDREVQSVRALEREVYGITFRSGGEKHLAVCNLADGPKNLRIQGRAIQLDAFESLVFSA